MDLNTIPEEKQQSVKAAIVKAAEDGRLPCATARDIAKTLDVPLSLMSVMADLAGVRIKNCQLGCF